MDFLNWEFSKEAQPELDQFLEVVNKTENEKFQLESKITEIFPELIILQDNLKTGENSIKNQNVTIDDDIIVIDEEENIEVNKTPLPDISFLSLTQNTFKQQKTEELNENVHVFIEYLLECLENEKALLENDHLTKLDTEFNNFSLNYIFEKLFDMSDTAIYNLNKSICKNIPLKHIPVLFCRIILFPKFQNLHPSKSMSVILKEFCETFPETIKQELLTLFVDSNSENITFFQTIVNTLNNSQKQCFLKDFVYLANELESFQIPILEYLLSFEIDDIVVRRLINLLAVSADKFKTDKLFMKLVITLINTLKLEFEDQKQILFDIIEKSNTANKIFAQKAFKKWTDKFDV